MKIASGQTNMDIWRTITVLLNRDIRPSGEHISDRAKHVAEVTSMILRNRLDYETLLADGWKPL